MAQFNQARSPLDEPLVIWRMRRPDGLTTRLVLGSDATHIFAAWYLNNTVMGARDFTDLESALQWADQMQAQYWTVGWRLVSDEHQPSTDD